MYNVFIGESKDNKVQLSDTNKARLNDLVRSLNGKPIRITIDRESGNISSEARGYYWAAIVPTIKNKYPEMTYEDVHEMLKMEFNGKWVTDFSGEKVKIGKSTSGPACKSHEFIEYISRITGWMVENGMEIPDPNDYKNLRDSAQLR